MQMKNFIANCGQTAADSDMVKVPQDSSQATLYASSDSFSLRCTI